MFAHLIRQRAPRTAAPNAGTRLRRIAAALAAVTTGLLACCGYHPGRLRKRRPATRERISARPLRAGPGDHLPRGRHRRAGLADHPDHRRHRAGRGRRDHRAGPGTAWPAGRPVASRLTRPVGSCTTPAVSPGPSYMPGAGARTPRAVPVPGRTARPVARVTARTPGPKQTGEHHDDVPEGQPARRRLRRPGARCQSASAVHLRRAGAGSRPGTSRPGRPQRPVRVRDATALTSLPGQPPQAA